MKKNIDLLKNVLNEINKEEDDLFDFSLEYDKSYDRWVIIDSYEEFYYEGYAFDRIHERIEETVKEIFGESAYIDCECPGRWIVAD